jgi:hypothetical protein
MPQPTLLDIAKQNGADGVVGLIDETIKVHPELLLGPARTIKGLNYKTLVRIGLPPSVGFRSANEGVPLVMGAYENRLVETFIWNTRWQCDKAVADRHEDGAPAFIALEASGIMEAAVQNVCAQFYYGQANDAKGFPGLVDMYDTTNMLIKAGGTTADEQTSVWAVRFGAADVQWVWGNNGNLDMDDVREESVLDAGGTNKFTAYVQELLAYPGLQVGTVNAVGRIANIHPTDAAGAAALTDDDLADLLETFPAGRGPTLLLMNRKALGMLRKSRTATNATGAPAPIPTEAFGVPIQTTDAITSTEAVVA